MIFDNNSPRNTAARWASEFALWLAGLAMVALAIWSAWDRGGGYLETQFVAALGVCLASTLVVAFCVASRFRDWHPPPLVQLTMLVCIIGYLQTIPIPNTIVAVVSPASAMAYQEWVPPSIWGEAIKLDEGAAGESDDSDSLAVSVNRKIPISVDVELTQRALAAPLTFACALWVASICVARRNIVLLFFATTAIAGALFSFFGLIDAVRLANYEAVELRQQLLIAPVGADSPFGPFVNSNNAGGYLILAMGCAVGAFVYFYDRSRLDLKTRTNSRDSVSPRQSWISHPRTLASQWNVIGWTSLIILIFAAILGSGSRGAFLGMVTGAAATAVIVVIRQPKKQVLILLATTLVIAVALLGITGMLTQSFLRIATIWNGGSLNDPRLEHWHDSLDAAREYFPAGCGLGAYRYGYLPFQSESGGAWFVHADGMPIEWMLEGGIWMPAIVAFAIFVLVRDLLRCAKASQAVSPVEACYIRAITMTGVFCVPGLLVSQCFDYGITHPPLFLTFAFIIGTVSRVAVHHQLTQSRIQNFESRQPTSRSGRCVLGGLVLVCVIGGLAKTTDIIYYQKQTQNAELLRGTSTLRTQSTSNSWMPRILQLESLLAQRPKDASTRRLLSQSILDQQCLLGADFLVTNRFTEQETVEKWVSPRTVRRAFYENRAAGKSLEDLMLPGQDAELWRSARGHAAKALTLCPLDVTSRVILIELDMVREHAAKATPELLEQAKRLLHANSRSLRFLQKLELQSDVPETADRQAQS